MNLKKLNPFLIFIIVCLTFGCEKVPEEIRPNIVWINCEDTGPNWGCYGDDYATTPNIDKLAENGVLYTKAFATAPICSPSRSCLITGLYATSLGTQHLRCEVKRPDFIRTLPEILSSEGYFTTNQAKTDYNFDPTGVWDYWKNELAPWRKRKERQPFFSMFVFGMTHEGSVNNSSKWEQNTADLPQELFHDPAEVPVPPYYPDSPEIRKIWSHYHDNITVFDRKVGEVVQNLKEDKLLDNTIIFVFSDHGTGLPRYKRWLNITGLHVPFLVYIPEKFKHMSRVSPGEKNNELVSFVDFAPTVLSIAGVDIPKTMEGQPFIGKRIFPPRKHVIGARSRADNMYEMSRAVITDEWIYVRHYYPHYPYIQPGLIFSDDKESLRELRRLKNEGLLHDEALKMWNAKPVEELYNLKEDPNELNNLAIQGTNNELMDSLRNIIHTWALNNNDTGFLPEAEYMIRSKNSTPYELLRNGDVALEEIIQSAELIGKADIASLVTNLSAEESGVRYWAVIGLQAMEEKAQPAISELKKMLRDESPSVQIAAAETVCKLGYLEEGLPVLENWLLDDRPQVALQAARSVELLGKKAKPLIPVLYDVIEKNKSTDPNSKRRYKDFNFAAFTTWSAEWALHNCGEDVNTKM